MLTSKTALVTGSTGGIGLATARALAAKGCNVMLHGLGDALAIEETREKISNEFGVRVGFNCADISKIEGIEVLLSAVQQELGPPDILVNNAVARNRGAIESFSKEQWDYALAVNLSAPFHLIRLSLPHMKGRNWGRIINIASNWGLTGTRNRVDYVASKHGIVGLTRAVALEVLEYGITCNAIAPGSTYTQHAENQLLERMKSTGKSKEEITKEFFKERQPSGRFVRPEDVGELIAFLCGDSASEMTGSPISIDGGWLAM